MSNNLGTYELLPTSTAEPEPLPRHYKRRPRQLLGFILNRRHLQGILVIVGTLSLALSLTWWNGYNTGQIPEYFRSHFSTLDISGTKRITPEDFIIPSSIIDQFDGKPITFIPYTFGYSILMQTLLMHKYNGWGNIVIIDNSHGRDAWVDSQFLREELGVVRVVLTLGQLKFSQVMGLMDLLIGALGMEWYFWAHSDVFLLGDIGTANASKEAKSGGYTTIWDGAIGCMEEAVKRQNIGVLYFYYDWLSAVRVEAGLRAPWDAVMQQYGSDCDRYSRIKALGLTIPAAWDPQTCPSWYSLMHTFKLFNMPGILSTDELSIVLDPYASLRDRLEQIQNANNNTDTYSWRKEGKSGMHTVDVQAFEAYKIGGDHYAAAKWGKDGKGDCVLENIQPRFDVPAIEMQFEGEGDARKKVAEFTGGLKNKYSP